MMHKCIRMYVETWTTARICGYVCTSAPEGGADTPREHVVVADEELPRTWLFEGARLNLLLCETDDEGCLHPQHIVLEPDYLVDVTAICRCATEQGDAPAEYLLQKFLPHTATAAIQLGAVANQFLDDVANAPEGTRSQDLYRHSLHKSFCNDPLRFSTVEGIDSDFSQRCYQHFEHIRQTLERHPVTNAQLETAFLCEALGIQGRMDLMSGDARTIIELKSGKGGYTRHPEEVAYRYEHALQMALYKESLYYNLGLPYAQVQTLLFYSLYPALLDIRLGRADIHRAMYMRNGIVHLERCLRTAPEAVFRSLSEADFNPLGRHDRFFLNYKLPSIRRLLEVFREADTLSQRYFLTMLAFVEREQSLAKTGTEGVDIPLGKHGFADVWRTSLAERAEAGNLIGGLLLREEHFEKDEDGALVRVVVPLTDSQGEPLAEINGLTSSNFRPGDLVMLHEEYRAAFYFPCIIESIGSETLTLRLRYPQRDTSALDLTRRYAIEPAHADSTYSVIYQGLFALLETGSQRRDLLLGRRPPRTTSRTLQVPIADMELRDIVLRAKQADDYFLLVGPPGTGKTSIALRQMVIEFLSEGQGSLLLMAFTNRAVDEICQMLTTIKPTPEYVRIGPEFATEPAYRGHTLSALTRQRPTRAHIRQLLLQTRIIVGTIASLSSSQELFQLKRFDAAIMDEASQVLEPQLLPLLCAQVQGEAAIRKFIFIGDHKQLPAVVAQSTEYSAVQDPELHAIGLTDCRQSLFERLHRMALHRGHPELLGMLHRQGRMHQDISEFASRRYYGGELGVVPLPHQTGDLEWHEANVQDPLEAQLSRQRLLCFDTSHAAEAGMKYNHVEALFAARVVASVSHLCERHGLPYQWSQRLGIIVPFRAQIQQLRSALSELQVPEAEQIAIDTVERYQGSQRDIILFSTVVGAPWQLPILSSPVETEGQLIDRKLNVAVTRARKQFILLGNLNLLATCQPYRELIMYIRSSSQGK